MAISRSLGGDIVDHSVADVDGAGAHLFQSGQHAQRGGFAAAGGTDEDEKFPVFDGDVQVVDGSGVAVALGNVFVGHAGHALAPQPLRPQTYPTLGAEVKSDPWAGVSWGRPHPQPLSQRERGVEDRKAKKPKKVGHEPTSGIWILLSQKWRSPPPLRRQRSL